MTASPQIEAFLAEPRNAMVAGVRRDGRPHLSPNWFLWDGERFYVSTTRPRVKYRIFRHDPRVELAVDDATGYRTVLVSGTVEVLEDVHEQLPQFRAIREKHGRTGASDKELEEILVAEQRVLLAITPSTPPEQWTTWGLD
ncbi:MAG TPA: PPOX class F420-dependent oxidoreductase [Acidimicrobiales bacterium]|nr:PPOX class F420-dependent oxidoreductase [Acidimicrobiales bacterium]